MQENLVANRCFYFLHPQGGEHLKIFQLLSGGNDPAMNIKEAVEIFIGTCTVYKSKGLMRWPVSQDIFLTVSWVQEGFIL